MKGTCKLQDLAIPDLWMYGEMLSRIVQMSHPRNLEMVSLREILRIIGEYFGREYRLWFGISLLIIDVAVSLAKVADVDRNLGHEDVAVDGFQEAVKCLESLTLNSDESGLEQKRVSVLEYLRSQLTPEQTATTV
ncbi:hypothetical protein C5167_046142 [Papaver somniferum]|uniref:Uncharacterized protein n=1 Tax=Papaver somniferum TaxID=3469 RepID=A0A4Y7LDQ0_PAPSO|nr:hypothetical protein C5167_046142 [Papaver somniferum]